MDNFFKQNKIFLTVIIGAAIIGGAIYLTGQKEEPVIEPGPSLTPASGTCTTIPDLPDQSLKLATKIIDGDTFLIEGGYSVRILGIDADERSYPCYDAAKTGLEELILNKEVKLEKGGEDLDQYCRYLRYAFLGDKDISLELVKEGLAVARFSPEDVKYREEITQAEKDARENKVGCKWSASVQVAGNKGEEVVLQWEKLTPEATNLKVIGACQAGNYYGKEMIIEGKIADAFRSKTNTIFLNFEKPYPNHCFTGVIFSSDQYRFVQSPEEYYLNKTVRIRGEIKEYQGKPEIILKDPSQIEAGE